MRLLSRVLAGSPARTGAPRAPEPRVPGAVPVLDDEMRDLLHRYVNSPVKLDLILYLHDNPYAIDSTDALALRLGREAPLVEGCAGDLVRAGLLEAVPGEPAGAMMLYRLTDDPAFSAHIARLARFHREGGALQVRAAIRDIGIAETVRAAIAGSGRASASGIEVRCEAGAVSVVGRVNTAAERTELDVICERLHESRYGIRAVENRVEVDARGRGEDGDVREAVASILAASMPCDCDDGGEGGGRVHVRVEVIGGVAYLTGLVESPQDRIRATQLAQETPGVADVVNWVDVQGYRSR